MTREKNYTGALGDFAPKMQQEHSKIKSPWKLPQTAMFNVADLVNRMWKVAPENKNLILAW